MRPPLRSRRPRGSALLVTLISMALASVVAILVLTQSSSNHSLAWHATVEHDARRAADSAMSLIFAHYEAALRANPDPDQALRGLTIPREALTPSTLGIDTSRYNAAIEWTAVRPGRAPDSPADSVPYGVKINTGPVLISDLNLGGSDPNKNNVVNDIWHFPIRVRVRLSAINNPTRDTLTVVLQGSLQLRSGALLQNALFYSAYTPFLWGGNNIYRGGIVANKNIYFWASGSSEGARIQIERVAAPGVYFRDYKTTVPASADGTRPAIPGQFPDALLPGNGANFNWTNNRVVSGDGALNPHRQAIYISVGDRNGDGRIVGYGGSSFQSTSQSTPNVAGTEYRPAYRTLFDLGGTNATSGNFWRTQASFVNPLGVSTNYESSYFRIDSDNPNIDQLASLFNGNFKDTRTGFVETQPLGLENIANPRGIIDPPATAPLAEPALPLVAKPASADDDPAAWATWMAYENSKSAYDAAAKVESAKFSAKSNLYLYVETTPRFPGDTVPRVMAFTGGTVTDPVTGATRTRTAAEAALAYKQTAIPDSAALDAARRDFANTLVNLPPSVVETNRRFIDYTQRKISASDTATPRVSAVDINIGALRQALGTAAAPATAITRTVYAPDGTTSAVPWNPDDGSAGWNGAMYVDVDNPKGDGWSAAAPDPGMNAAPLTDNGGNATENLTAVRIHNAQQIPTRAGVATFDTSTDPTREGFTLATNTAVYTVGSINADGLTATDASFGTSSGATGGALGSPSNSTSAETNSTLGGAAHLTAMSIACDSLTVMPQNHGDPGATGVYDLTRGDNIANTAGPGAAQGGGAIYSPTQFTELNFALVSGGVDPNKFNIPKHPLQTFSPACATSGGGNYRYRGSVNQLFLATYNRKWSQGTSGTMILGQSLDIGFNANYARGYLPPGTPSFRTFTTYGYRQLRPNQF